MPILSSAPRIDRYICLLSSAAAPLKMASHITTPAMNSQSLHKLNTLDSMQSVRSNSSRKGKRSSIEHIQESLKIVRKKAVNARKNTAVIPWIVPSRYRVVKPEEDFDVCIFLTEQCYVISLL